MDNNNDDRIIEHQRRLTLRVPLPNDIDGHSDEMKKITCYNRNVANTTCTAIKGLTKPLNECIAYCPHYTKQGLVQ